LTFILKYGEDDYVLCHNKLFLTITKVIKNAYYLLLQNILILCLSYMDTVMRLPQLLLRSIKFSVFCYFLK
jgi:hypothetical protein